MSNIRENESRIFYETEIVLVKNRCYDCGGFYAVESSKESRAECPYCARSKCTLLTEELKKAEHTAASLRGHITTIKKKQGKI